MNPFCLPLKQTNINHKMKVENRDKMYKLNYAQDLGFKQNEWKRDKDMLWKRGKKYNIKQAPLAV